MRAVESPQVGRPDLPEAVGLDVDARVYHVRTGYLAPHGGLMPVNVPDEIVVNQVVRGKLGADVRKDRYASAVALSTHQNPQPYTLVDVFQSHFGSAGKRDDVGAPEGGRRISVTFVEDLVAVDGRLYQ
jgi:hypothetical protein